ncbi:MAG: restriction endonuclease subunit S [Bacteroidota bacterium]|nr:restriction endonuclease subunit S [Bacteroidota bacterium]
MDNYQLSTINSQLPKDWEIRKLGEVFKLKSGDGLTAKNMIEGQYPVFGGNGIAGYHNQFNSENEVIIGRVGALCGNVRKINTKFWLTDNAFRISKGLEYFNSNFVVYMLNYKDLRSFARQAAQPVISNSSLKDVLIKFPKSIEEQKRIVSILDHAFEAIDKAKVNAEQNLKNAKELFESYLQGVFENKGDDWEEDRLKNVCELKSGTTISPSLERNEGDVLYTKVRDMNLPENEVEINTSSRFVNSNEIKTNQIIPEGAIIFPKRGGAIATNKKRKIVSPTIVDLNTMAIIPSKKIDKNYFFHWFQLFDLKSISNGANIPQINNYSFDDVYIPYPKSIKEQQIIVRQLDALSAETKKLESIYQQKIDDFEELKKSVLQKAFNGEL